MNTPTNTPVNTATYTPTFTRTFTGTYTPTETATSSFTATPTFTATMISPATDLSVWHGSLAPLNVGIGQTGVWFMAISLYNDAIPGSASLRVGGVTITAVDGLGAPLALSSALDRVSIVDVSGMTVYSTVNVSLYASQDVYLEFSIPVDVPAANTRTVYVSADISLTPAFTACRLRVKDAAAFAASNLPSGAITVSAGQGDAFPMDSNPVTLVVFTETYTITETATETPYYSPTGTPTDTASATASVSPSNTYTGTPTDTPIDTITASPTVTMTNTPTLTPTPTAYVSPTITPTAGQPDAGPGKSYCYPQPAHDWLRIVYSLPAAETVTIKIYNFAGIPVDSETDIGAAGDANMKEIDIKKFSPGIYFYLVKRSNVLPMTGKFLVVK
jgi:hypothetical protein